MVCHCSLGKRATVMPCFLFLARIVHLIDALQDCDCVIILNVVGGVAVNVDSLITMKAAKLLPF